MSFISVDLPAPAANASGAAVDVSAMGALKTISILGNGFTFEPSVQIEVSVDSAGLKWAPITLTAGQSSILVACHWMRATVSNYKGGGSPSVTVGGLTNGTVFQALDVPTGDGSGTASDVSDLPSFKSVQVGGPFGGNLTVEVSEDGGVTYSQVLSFAQPGIQTAEFVGNFMRVSRNGVPLTNPGLPIVTVGATNAGTGGSGSIDFAPGRSLFVATSWPLGADPDVYFTTIQDALVQAATMTPTDGNAVGIFVYPGTYAGDIALVSNAHMIAADVGGAVQVSGNVTWTPGLGVNAPQNGTSERLGWGGFLMSGGTAVTFTYNSVGKTGNAFLYLDGSIITTVNWTGRKNQQDSFFVDGVDVLNAAASGPGASVITDVTGDSSSIGAKFVGCRLRGITFAGATQARIEGGEILGGSFPMALTGTSNLRICAGASVQKTTVASGCTLVMTGCDINNTCTVAAGGAADLRGSNYNGNGNLLGAGTINRTTWNQTTAATGVGANAIVWTVPYPDGTYTVQAQLVSGPGNAAMTITAKTGTGCTLTDSVGGNVWDLTVIHD